MRFNVNDKVRVKLTEHGRAILKVKVLELNGQYPGAKFDKLFPEPDAEGWTEWQLWGLMHEFGQHCYNGCRLPFETEIEIIEGQHA